MMRHWMTVLAATLAVASAGCAPTAGDDVAREGGRVGSTETAQDDAPATATAPPARVEEDVQVPENGPAPQADDALAAERRADIERVRRGSSGPTTPVYHPELADEPGRSFATREEAVRHLEEQERQRQREQRDPAK